MAAAYTLKILSGIWKQEDRATPTRYERHEVAALFVGVCVIDKNLALRAMPQAPKTKRPIDLHRSRCKMEQIKKHLIPSILFFRLNS